MASPRNLGEIRTSTPSASISSSFANPDTFASSANKIRVVAKPDVSSLVHAVEDDSTLKSDLFDQRAPIPTVREGTATIEMYLPSANADTTSDALVALLASQLGGIQAPSARSYVASGTHTPTTIQATDIDDEVSGCAVLIGVRGDGRGNGEVRVIVADSVSNEITIDPPIQAAVQNGDSIVISTTIFSNPHAGVQYFDALVIDHEQAAQHQLLGCVMSSIELSATKLGEMPKIKATLSPVSWRRPTSNLASLSGDLSVGNDPPSCPGSMILTDQAASVRTAYAGSLDAVGNMGVAFLPVEGPNGPMGCSKIQSYVRGPVEGGLTADLTLLADLQDDLAADFDAGTTKQFIYQWGHVAQGCVAMEMYNCHLREYPADAEYNGLSGVKANLRASSTPSASTPILRSAIRWHMF